MSEEPLFTEEHQRAICEACEKLWNGSPPENPIYGPRPEGHPLRIVANKAHEALNAALAMETQYLQAAAKLAAAEAALAACEARHCDARTHHRGRMIEHCWHSTGYGTQYLNYPSSGGTEGVQCCRCGLSTTLRYSNERSYSPVEGHGPHWKQETVKREYHPPPDLPACTPAPLP